jgi:hypothetical protein
MANEVALDDMPTNLSEILKNAKESFMMDSREELMDIGNDSFLTDAQTNSYSNLMIEGI